MQTHKSAMKLLGVNKHPQIFHKLVSSFHTHITRTKTLGRILYTWSTFKLLYFKDSFKPQKIKILGGYITASIMLYHGTFCRLPLLPCKEHIPSHKKHRGKNTYYEQFLDTVSHHQVCLSLIGSFPIDCEFRNFQQVEESSLCGLLECIYQLLVFRIKGHTSVKCICCLIKPL
jgi:hypothetical protein